MARVLMYLTAACPYCQAAQRLLAHKGVAHVQTVRVDLEAGRRAEMVRRAGSNSVPQIWIGGRHVGGCDELHALERDGTLDRLLLETERT